MAPLYQEIGRLKMELDGLKKIRHSLSGACCLKKESAKYTGQNLREVHFADREGPMVV